MNPVIREHYISTGHKARPIKGLVIFLAIMLSVLPQRASAQLLEQQQPYKRLQYGIFADGGINYQRADFATLPGVPNCCPKFNEGTGWGIGGGAFAEIPLSGTFFIMPRIGFDYNANKLTTNESFIYNMDGNPQLGQIQHLIKTRFYTVDVDLTGGMHPFWGTTLFAGLRGGFHLGHNYDQWETLITPANGTFDNGRRTRNEIYNGVLPSTQPIQLALVGGLGYEMPLNAKRTIRFAPEIVATLPLNAEVRNYNWWNISIKAGFSLKFSVYPVYPLSIDISSIDTLKIDHSVSCRGNSVGFNPPRIVFIPEINSSAGVKNWSLKISSRNMPIQAFDGRGDSLGTLQYAALRDSARLAATFDDIDYRFDVTDNDGKSLSSSKAIHVEHINRGTSFNAAVYGIDPSGALAPGQALNIEESLSTVVKPLLNCIFFDEGNSVIPAKYNRLTRAQARSFSSDDINRRSPIAGYYDVLNLLGKRMWDHPEVRLMIEGCNSGKDPERNDTSLALRRASAVRDYLVETWSIAPQRLVLGINRRAGGAPRHPSFPHDEGDIVEAKTENMRAEIHVLAGHDILSDPLIYADTAITYNPRAYVFKSEVYSPTAVAGWDIDLAQGPASVHKYSGKEAPKPDIYYNLEESIRTIAKNARPIDYSFVLSNTDHQVCESNGTIPVKVEIADSMLHISGILLFSFESFELGEANLKVLDYIRQALRDGSQISIIGYTDKSGFDRVNQRLSKNRALAAASLLLGEELTEDMGYGIANYASPYVIKKRQLGFVDANKRNATASLLVLGVGKQEPLLSDNSIPEGRFYSRAVTIDVKVPVR